MTDRRTHLDTVAVLVLVVLCASWGLQQVAIKVANTGISPLLQAGLRSAGAALLVWGWAAARGIPLFGRDGTLGVGLLAGALFAGEFALIYLGLLYTTASRSVLFLYTSPFVVALGAHLFVPGERLRVVQTIGLLCAFAGIAVAFGDGLRLPTRRELLGDVMIVGAAVLWGATTVVIKASRLVRIAPAKTLFYQLAVSAIALPALSWAVGEPGITSAAPLVLGSLAYQTIVVAFISYLAWFWLISRYPASRLAAFSFLTPMFGMLAGGILLSEPISAALALALVLIAGGIYLVNRRDAPSPAPAVPAASNPTATDA